MPKPVPEGKVVLKDAYRTLRSHHRGDISRERTIELLKNISPVALLKVEQALFKKGFTMNDLKGISDIYAEIFYDRSKETIGSLGADHPIRILLVEHVMIKLFLRELDLMRDVLADPKKDVDHEKYRALLTNLEELEKHFQREENAIFSRLVEADLSARVDILSKEHNSFLNHEIRLFDLSDHTEKNRKKISDILDYLLSHIRFHAFTEGALLYPVALNVIDDWELVKEDMDIIGQPEFVAVGNFKPMMKKKDDELTQALDELAREEPICSGYLLDDEGDE